MSLVGDRIRSTCITYTLIVVNMEVGEHHPDRKFSSMNDLEQFCDTEHPGWTSLVVTVLPRVVS